MNQPDLLTRREFVTRSAMAAAGLAVSKSATAEIAGQAALPAPSNSILGVLAINNDPVTIGSGYYTYELVSGWGAPPAGMKYDMGCAIVVDSQDRVYVHTRADKAVLVFDREGKLLYDFGGEFARTGHGLYWSKEGKDEFLYFSDHPRNLVVKTDLHGKVLLKIGREVEESSASIRFPLNQPTDVAIAPNGDFYVCEGYGGNLVHVFTAQGKYRKTIGEPGSGPGQFRTPHGIWIDARNGKDPEVYVADRNNKRVQVFTPSGDLKRIIAGDIVRNPCCFYEFKGKMYIPDLDHRVTILDENDEPVAQLGDGKMKDDDSTFRLPHAMTVDSRGDMYIVEWVPDARLRKFKHAPRV